MSGTPISMGSNTVSINERSDGIKLPANISINRISQNSTPIAIGTSISTINAPRIKPQALRLAAPQIRSTAAFSASALSSRSPAMIATPAIPSPRALARSLSTTETTCFAVSGNKLVNKKSRNAPSAVWIKLLCCDSQNSTPSAGNKASSDRKAR